MSSSLPAPDARQAGGSNTCSPSNQDRRHSARRWTSFEPLWTTPVCRWHRQVGRAGFQHLAQGCEIAEDTVVNEGRVYRFKQVVNKEWMTLWGKVVMPRRLYQHDRGGASRVPLDERCGMVNRFMVPALERVTAFLGTCLPSIRPACPRDAGRRRQAGRAREASRFSTYESSFNRNDGMLSGTGT